MAKDPLVTLQKLRRLEAQAERRALAEKLAAEASAQQALAAAEMALRQESSEGLNPQLGAFIQKALDDRAAIISPFVASTWLDGATAVVQSSRSFCVSNQSHSFN